MRAENLGGAGAVDDCEVAMQLCEFLFETLEGALPYERIAIVAVEADEVLVQRAVRAREPDRVIPKSYQGSLRRGTLAGVLAGGIPRVLNRLAAYAAHAESGSPTHLLLKEGYQASLTCPLEHEGDAVGLLFFNSRSADVYRPEHAEIVRRIAPAISRVLASCAGVGEAPSQAAMTRSLAAIGRAARAASEEEALLARVLEQVRDGMVVDDVLDRLYEHCHALLPYDRVQYATVEGDRVVARWARSRFPVHLPRGFSQRLAATSLPEVIEAGTPRIINDLAAHAAHSPCSRGMQIVIEEGQRASLTFFLGAPEAPLGFLFFTTIEPGVYTSAHVSRLRRLTAPLTAMLEKARLYEQLALARARSEELLHMLMPPSIAARLQAGETDIAEARETTVLFADLVNFTGWSSPLTPAALLLTLRGLFARFHESAERRGVSRIRVMGDGYRAAAGVADAGDDHPERAALHALDILDIVRTMRSPDGDPIAVRIGIHTGPVVAGVLGGGDLRFDIWGPSVSVAARLESHGAPGRIQVSEATAKRLEGRFALEPRGETHLKGLGPTPTWWLGAQSHSVHRGPDDSHP
ncbi:MAG: hypothetical protein IPF99_30145 [Deltaproteobacteria bacterium]|nr:hypothetical protein [Deltaproteobacteria bacterium]